MGKKIFYVLISLFAFSFCITVKAETRACTDEEIRTARASLSHEQAIAVSIPSLGRTSSAGRAYFYKMKLTNKNNNTVFNSFCLDSAKPSRNNTIYKIDREVTSDEWKKAYQYAITFKYDDLRYITAQSAIWLLRGTNGLSYSKENLKKVSRDVYINLKCESLMQLYGGMSEATAASTCERAKASDDSTGQIQNTLFNAYQNRNYGMGMTNFIRELYLTIDARAEEYISFRTYYSGKLYWWVAEDNKDYYQGMLAPLNCDGNTTDRLYCTDSSGNKHYYADDSEYNQCIQSGGNETVCKSNFDLKYCNGGDTGNKYIVKRTGNGAVCTNYTSNIGTYYEYVAESNEGTAIPGKGEPEKVINSYCNLYCLENIAQQVFPGNVRPAVSVGTYIIWPTSESTLSSKYKNKYPLSFMGQKTCYVVMSGNESTVNNIPLTTYYNDLVNSIPNNAYGRYAGKYYEASRLSNGGCNSVYENICGRYSNETNSKYNAWQNYVNSEEFKSLESSRNSKIEHNNGVTTCNQTKNQALEVCTSEKTSSRATCSTTYRSCLRSQTPNNTCRTTYSDCLEEADIHYNDCESLANKNECGNIQTVTREENDAISRASSLETAYNVARNESDACANERAACNNYTDKVNALITFSNNLKTCATYTPTCSGSSCDIYNYATNVDLSWGDPEYGKGNTITDSQLEKSINYYLNISSNSNNFTNVSSSQDIATIKHNLLSLINEVTNVTNNRQINASVNVTYSLPTTNLLYNYVVKRNDSFKSQTSKPSSDSNFTTVGFSNLPISYNAKTNVSYELRLSNIRFGDNGGQYNPSDYVCNYNVTKTLPVDCLCEDGDDVGKDLSNIMIDEELTCSEAKAKYCNNNTTDKNKCPDGTKEQEMTSCQQTKDYFTCYDLYCRDGSTQEDKFCPNDPSINMTPCLNNYNYNYCYNLLCEDSSNPDNPNPPDGDGYKCKNTNDVDGAMDITACVITKRAQGLSKSEAINECDALICPLSGLRIIYRTISLENPFPSKTADTKITQSGLKIGMFNDDILGRYPGTNWNDSNLVKNHILYVTRQGNKIDGSNIYQSEPLYRFELNTSTINAIRNYNKTREANGGYADFTLECRLNNSRACVSEVFVHNSELSGLVSGVCMNSTSLKNFYSCSGDD